MHNLISQIIHSLIPIAHAQDSSTGSQSVTELLGINWKLFIAQLVNFSIVFFVLWKWVFGPLGKKLTERSERIEKSIQQSKEIEQRLEQTEEERRWEIEKARKQAVEIIAKAQRAAGQSKDEILAEAQAQAQKLIEQTKKQLHEEKSKLIAEVREQAATLVVAATEKILREKIDQKKDEQLIKESLKNI